MKSKKIVSWNVNGIRAVNKKGGIDWFLNFSPDILCIQETKASPEQLDEGIRNPEGYFSYFSSSEIRKGYSGVAVYTKEKPEKVEHGIGIKKFDEQGRTLILFYKDFVLINAYVPNGGSPTANLDYKLEFYDALLNKAEKLKKKPYSAPADAKALAGKKATKGKYRNIVICGDINVAHEEIDLARPKENQTNIGFLPIERAWIDGFLNSGYIDVFRHFNPNKEDAYTYWDQKSFARERNVGWRIDYFFINSEFLNSVKKIEILNQVYGSDHCPILLETK